MKAKKTAKRKAEKKKCPDSYCGTAGASCDCPPTKPKPACLETNCFRGTGHSGGHASIKPEGKIATGKALNQRFKMIQEKLKPEKNPPPWPDGLEGEEVDLEEIIGYATTWFYFTDFTEKEAKEKLQSIVKQAAESMKAKAIAEVEKWSLRILNNSPVIQKQILTLVKSIKSIK